MAVYSWTFDGTLRKHLVEIEHIPSSGKLKLYLNRHELLQTEGIKEKDWKHLFYIDQELVLAEVKWQNGDYLYDFREEEQHESRRIRRAKSRARREISKYVAIALIAIVAITVVPFYVFNRTEWYRNIRLGRGEGAFVPATFYWNELGPSPELTYVYNFRGEEFHGVIDTADQRTFRTPEGMPIWNGDQFRVRLIPDHPRSHVADLSRVSDKTLLRYQERSATRLGLDSARLNFVNHDSLFFIRCLIDYVTEQYGIPGLAHIYFNHEPEHATAFEAIIHSRSYQVRRQECYAFSADTAWAET
jgi:hypothetical protein